MSELVFLKDSYLKELKAKVLSVEGNAVEFDKTIFYPEGGGQESDSGSIEWNGKKAKVVSVKKQSGKVMHFLEGETPKVGEEVLMKLEWESRYKTMKMHSAQHLLSAIILDFFGASTAGNQIHAKRSRMDFFPIKFDEEILKKITEKFNQAVKEEKEIRIYTTTREKVLEEVEEKRRRLFATLPESIKEIRVVEIVDYDKCPCAGTHVRNTKEIGFIKIVQREAKGKDKDRLVFELEEKE